MIKKILILFILLLALVETSMAVDRRAPCKTNKNLPKWILYKPTNVHGGRGPSLITSWAAVRVWAPCKSLKIYSRSGKVVGRFGCYDPGGLPYGRRYYTGVRGGSYSNANTLYLEARRNSRPRSGKVYIDASRKQNMDVCWEVLDPRSRQGSL